MSPTSNAFRRSCFSLDVVDSTRLIESDERRSIHRWLDFVQTIENAILPAHKGGLVNQSGDGLFLERR